MGSATTNGQNKTCEKNGGEIRSAKCELGTGAGSIVGDQSIHETLVSTDGLNAMTVFSTPHLIGLLAVRRVSVCMVFGADCVL